MARTSGQHLLAGGTHTASGDGIATTFTIAHGLAAAPAAVSVEAASAAARSDFSVSVDATNITVTYGTAPSTGTNNLSWHWLAKVV